MRRPGTKGQTAVERVIRVVAAKERVKVTQSAVMRAPSVKTEVKPCSPRKHKRKCFSTSARTASPLKLSFIQIPLQTNCEEAPRELDRPVRVLTNMRDFEASDPRPDRRPVPVASSRCASRVGRAIPSRPTSTSLRSNAPADRYSPCHRAAGEQLHRFEYSALDSHWNAGSQFAELFARRLPQADAMSKTPPSADDSQARRRNRQAAKARQERQETVSSCCAGSNRRYSTWLTMRTGLPESPRRRRSQSRKCDGARASRPIGLTTHV